MPTDPEHTFEVDTRDRVIRDPSGESVLTIFAADRILADPSGWLPPEQVHRDALAAYEAWTIKRQGEAARGER